MLRRALILGQAFLAVGLMTACSPQRYTDDDESCSRAKPLPPAILVKDSLKVAYGDRSDCKQVRYFKDAVAHVEYRIGTAFEKHNIKGLLTVYDGDGQVLDQKAVDPSMFRYPFEFDVKAGKPYYVEFKATQGDFPYSAEVKFVKNNPCARCGPEQECVDDGRGGKLCRAPLKGCDPPCDEEGGKICSEGQCVDACNPACRRGFQCDVDTQECVRAVRVCRPKCKRGYYCSRRSGRCFKKAQHKGCAGGCKPGFICKGGQCTRPGVVQKCPACPNPTDVCSAQTGFKCLGSGSSANTGPIVGRVASTVRSGQGTILYLNRGTRHGVKKNKRGTLCGKYKFVITNAFATRSKARTNATIEAIGGCKKVIIRR